MEDRKCIQNLIGNSLEKSFGRMRRRLEDNTNMNIKEIRYEDDRWVELAQDCVQW